MLGGRFFIVLWDHWLLVKLIEVGCQHIFLFSYGEYEMLLESKLVFPSYPNMVTLSEALL